MNLKPCPFCGGEAIFAPLGGSHGYIECIGACGIKTGDFWDEPMTAIKDERETWKDRAAEAWNRRALNE